MDTRLRVRHARTLGAAFLSRSHRPQPTQPMLRWTRLGAAWAPPWPRKPKERTEQPTRLLQEPGAVAPLVTAVMDCPLPF
jgi:hypothetical protein